MSLESKLKEIAYKFNKENKRKEKYVPLNTRLVTNIEEVMNFIETNYYFIECANRGHYRYKMICSDKDTEIWTMWSEMAKHPLTHKDITFYYEMSKVDHKKKHYLIFTWKD